MTSDSVLPVVSTEWLNQKLTSSPKVKRSELCVIDCSWSSTEDMRQVYLKKHIPTAVHMHPMYKTAPTDVYPRPVPDPEVMQPYLRSLGVSSSSHVVLYDNNGQCGFFVSGRAWWTLKYFGVKKVSILNGGLQKWVTDGYPATDVVPEFEGGDVTVTLDPSVLGTFDELDKNLKTRSIQVVDTRPPGRYTGSSGESPAGHYPGAVNVPFHAKLLNMEAGVMRSPDEIRDALQSAGVDLSRPIISTCNSGMSSSTLVIAAHLLGLDAKLYVTGMVEWSNKKPDQLILGDNKE